MYIHVNGYTKFILPITYQPIMNVDNVSKTMKPSFIIYDYE